MNYDSGSNPSRLDPTTLDDEEQRRLLQKYIFELEETHDKVDDLSIAHENLKRSQDLLIKVLSSTRQGICLVKNRKIVWCNSSVTSILGWEQKDLLKHSTKCLFPSDDDYKKISAFVFQKARNDELPSFEFDLVHKNGKKIPCLITGQPVDHQNLAKGYVFSITDFTENATARKALKKAYEELEVRVNERTAQLAKANRELLGEIGDRKRAEEAAKSSEEKYRNILDSMEDGYFEVDLMGNLIFFNCMFCKMTGFSKDELTGKNFSTLTDEESILKLHDSFQQVYKTGQSGKIKSFNIIAKDGSRIIVETPLSLILDKSNQPIGFRGLARDVTEKIQMELRLQRAQKMEAVGSLAGGVAHDLNNILSGIVSYPELLLMSLPEKSDLREPITTIKRSGEKAVAIVQDLLTLARRGVPVHEVTNLNAIVLEYLNSPEHRSILSFHPDLRLEWLLEDDLSDISCSPVHLSKTVMNLVSNAAEAMPNGGTITIVTKNERVEEPVCSYEEVPKGEYAVLRVQDKGIGIPAEDCSKIFEPFYTKKKMGRSGTGLGMAVVWGTVKDHDGYIDVQSTEGKGTSVTLYFPKTRKIECKQKSHLVSENRMGNGESILVIDDIEEQRVIASKILEKLGYSVAAVSSGEEAVAYLENNSADLLILDIIMDPGMNGFETYKKILERHPGQKAIIASGYSETGLVKQTKELGAGPYLKKPYSIEKLSSAVKSALN